MRQPSTPRQIQGSFHPTAGIGLDRIPRDHTGQKYNRASRPHLPALGIIGGGQLARMMAQAARRLGLSVVVLDPTPDAPAAQLADHQVVADFHDAAGIAEVAERSDVTTFDLENVDARTAEELSRLGHKIFPSPTILATIQDKLAQRDHLAARGIPVPRYAHIGEPDRAAFAAFGYPLVQKARVGGYDGRGVQVLKSDAEFDRALPADSIAEELVDIAMELSVIVARGHDGQVTAYSAVEMAFDHDANILDLLIAPARIDDTVARRATVLARRAVDSLNGVGVFAVELFLTHDGELLVNEIAPRPHNSGHFSIEACETDQFEQHVRAVLGLPLGSTRQKSPAVMLNLLGAPGQQGPYRVVGLTEALAIPGVAVHLYGKHETRPYRKMGHVTVCGDSLDLAIQRAREVKDIIRIEGVQT